MLTYDSHPALAKILMDLELYQQEYLLTHEQKRCLDGAIRSLKELFEEHAPKRKSVKKTKKQGRKS